MTPTPKTKDVNWFICTLGKSTSHNWDICKEHKIWGIPTNGRKYNLLQAKKGDLLLFYLASVGFLGFGQVTGAMRIPSSKEEAPWAGGIYRYGVILPFKLLKEVETPPKVNFVDNKLDGTGVSTTLLRRGFAQVSTLDGLKIQESFFPTKK
jgi:hypothetical protein